MNRIATKISAVLCTIFLLVLFTACGGGGGGGGGGASFGPSANPIPPNRPLPDLSFSVLQAQSLVQGQVIRAGVPFMIVIYVQNRGTAPSGVYDVKFTLRDLTRGGNYAGGVYPQPSIRPGENVPAITEYDPNTNANILIRNVNSRGRYEIRASIVPRNGIDGNPGDNQRVIRFDAF